MKKLWLILFVAFIVSICFPAAWIVAGVGDEAGIDPQSTHASEYVSYVLGPIIAAARFFSCAFQEKKTEIRQQNYPVSETGWLIPEEMFLGDLETGAYVLNSNSTVTTCLGFGDESKLGQHCVVMCEKTSECMSPESKGSTLLGWTTSTSFVLRKCLCNAHNALCCRHGSKQQPVKRDLEEVLPDFLRALEPHHDSYWLCEMLNFAVWLAKWPFGKQKSILRSQESELEAPNKVKAMVKREGNHKKPSKARLIQFYWNLATQALFGPQFYAVQKTICHVFRRKYVSSDIDVTFASGMKAGEVGEWMSGVLADGAISFYERDGKNWDASMQEMHAKFRQSIYRAFDAELGDFASSCDKVKGFAVFPGGPLRYKMDYTVKSGHNDTTLGNSLVNAAIAYAAFKRLGLRASILVTGDDLLVAAYDPLQVDTVSTIEAEYGIQPEARVFDDYEQVTFVSGMWISDGTTMGFVPLPGRLFARLWWSVKPPGAKNTQPYLRGVSRGLQPVAGTLPLVRVLLAKFDSAGVGARSDKGLQFRGSDFRFGIDIWRAFERRYGLSTDEMMDCEEWLKSLPAKPLLLKHPVLDRLMEVDLADISDRGATSW